MSSKNTENEVVKNVDFKKNKKVHDSNEEDLDEDTIGNINELKKKLNKFANKKNKEDDKNDKNDDDNDEDDDDVGQQR